MSTIRFNQSVATAGKSTFIYDFRVLNKEDIAVFLAPSGQDPNDENDRLILDSDYVVEGVGENAGGQIVLTQDANAGDIITLVGQRKPQPPSEFQAGQLSADELNVAFDGLTVLIEDIDTKIIRQMVFYDASNVFLPDNDQTKLPVLGQNEVWVGTINNGIVKVEVPDSVDAGILRAQLEDEQSGQDGSRIVGYSNTVFTPQDLTVHDALARLDTKVEALEQPANVLEINENIILGGDFGTNPFQEGLTFPIPINSFRHVADGWLVEMAGATMQAKAVQSSNVPTISGDGAPVLFTNSLVIEVIVQQAILAPADFAAFFQFIEGNFFRPIAQQEMTLSFWVYSALPGIYCAALLNGGRDRFIVKEYTINAVNTWQLITLDFPPSPVGGTWDYGPGVGLEVTLTLGAGTDHETATPDQWLTGDSFSTANQVNFMGEVVGSLIFFEDITLSTKTSLPLPRRNAQQELIRAQRYLEKSYNLATFPGALTSVGSATGLGVPSADQKLLNQNFKVSKRITPIMTWFSNITGIPNTINVEGVGDVAAPSTAGQGQNTTGAPVTGAIPTVDSLNGQWFADARLI